MLNSIKLHSEKSFETTVFHLDSEGDLATDKGTFSVDQGGRHIVLKFKDGYSEVDALGENKLTTLDQDGNKN